MAKFTGYMCDVCKQAENGNDRPIHWLGVRMPTSSNTENPEVKDLCSDKCLLKFARERAGVGTGYARPTKSKIAGLSEFLDEHGIKPSAKGAISARHARLRHEMGVPDEECLVCEFLTNKEEGE
jgi:hypothetical protein